MEEITKSTAEAEETAQEVQTEEVKPEEVKKYTDADLDRIISEKIARERKKQEAAVNEAKRLAEMSAQERAEAERDKLQAELNELKAAQNRAEMARTARAMLSEKGVSVSDDVVNVLIKDDAEATKKAVESFAETFTAAVDAGIKNKLGGEPPKVGASQKALTRADIEAVKDRTERQRLIRENIELFK